ncbi:type II secretion system F family protein [Siminovitchia fortis]|uniref:Type II secretion system F family protein n=1 Tax=Siminovitchia fortis TaxID=254758 RepID=A0A443IUU8_9BACI|nr:type II secretion system F family protein [Siminovitchia fortis]RWR11853.1 type II secretion system F family protein [Siminovitchia fortis]WHY81867.1 type II secretion system F family protein [Siminovitchia fortis]
MPVYKFVGRTMKGAVKRGTIESDNRNQAIKQLREKGISPREVNETKATIFNKNISLGGKNVKNQHFVVYCRQFATLIRAGISIVDSTHILAEQTESKGLANALREVETEIRGGVAFSDAVQKHPKIFPAIFINMVRAGEMTGNLDETLDRLASYYEKQYNLKKKIQSTMAYPIVLMVLIVAVVIFLMLSIVPNFTSMFEQFGGDLPAITKFVVMVSDWIQQLWWLGLIFVAGITAAFLFLYRSNKEFNYSVHVALLKMPIFGALLQKAAIARMTRTLSSLFASSVPILQALDIVEKVAGNPVVGRVVRESRNNLEKGSPLSDPLKKSWVFPPLVSHMTAIGEQTGSLDYMLAKIADFYEDEVERSVDSLKSLIEPVMIVTLATVVGFIVLSIMIPMFTIFTEIQ